MDELSPTSPIYQLITNRTKYILPGYSDDEKYMIISELNKGLWEFGSTFDYLQALNIGFINGTALQTPYHFGPLDPESSIIFKQLNRLNRLDVITVNSQPFEEFVGYDGKAYRQRPYVDFYYPTRKLDTLIQRFLQQTNTATFIHITPSDTFVYNEDLIKPLALGGYVPLIQVLTNHGWVDDTSTSIPLYQGLNLYEYNALRDTGFYQLLDKEISVCKIVDTQFSNEVFDILVQIAYELFFD